MIEMYKILSGKYDTAVTPRVNREYSSITRGNDLRIQKIELHMICASIILLIGHLTFGIVYLTMLFCLIQLTCLNYRLDKFWQHQDLIYDFKAEISGTGSRSCY